MPSHTRKPFDDKQANYEQIAALEVKGFAKADIINRMHSQHGRSKQSWRNFLGRYEDEIANAVNELKSRKKGQTSTRDDPSDEISASSDDAPAPSSRKAKGKAPPPRLPTSASSNKTRASSPTSSNRRRPRPGKRAHQFVSSDSEDDENRDELESSPQPAQKKAKHTQTPKAKMKPKPRASAPAGPAFQALPSPDDSTAAPNPQPEPKPQRAQSLPPATAAVGAEEESEAEEESVPAAKFTETQAHRFDADPEDDQPLDNLFDGLDDDDDDDYEEEEEAGDESGEVAASLKPASNQREAAKEKRTAPPTTSPVKSSMKASASSKGRVSADGFGKNQAREMLQPTKKASGSRVGWDSPEHSQRSARKPSGSKHPMASSSKEKGKQAARITASSRRQDSVCEPGTNEDELHLFKFILDFADEWNLTPEAAHNLAFRCSNDAQIMHLYMRQHRNIGKALDGRETELLEACFWSAKDDLDLRPGSKSGNGWNRLEARSSIEAMQTRRNFLAMHR